VAGKGGWATGVWTLELARKLITGSHFDVQLSDLSKDYFFGVAAVNNVPVRHAFQTSVNDRRFAP
jgi:hypothetical protein